MLEILPVIKNNNPNPLYIQVYEYIKSEILNGNIPHGSKLPSIRSLAKDLKLGKNTIENAYEQLIAEGYVKARKRSGLYVEKIDSDINNFKNLNAADSEQHVYKTSDESIKYDFRSGQIDLDLFPYNQFRKILNRCMDESNKELLLYGEHKGDYGFRCEIAKYIHHSRGVVCTPDQIIISSGNQQSLTMLCHIISRFYKTIAFEEPGFFGAKAVFKHFEFKLYPVRLQEDGIDIEKLKETDAKIVYVTPSHQYPFGMAMPISKRQKLLQWAKEQEGFIIEDDYDGEFRYRGKPIPSLQGMDDSGNVVYLGFFSKSLMPSIRISYMVLPQKLLKIYTEHYKVYEQPVPRLIQKALEIFMEEGYWDKHLRKSKVVYKKKHDELISSVEKYFGNNAVIIGADSGLHILLKIKTKFTEKELIKKAQKNGIKLTPISVNYLTNIKREFPLIFIGFAGIKMCDINDGIRCLKESWF